MNVRAFGEQEWWKTDFPKYLGFGTAVLILIISYLAEASSQAILSRTIISGIGMFIFGKFAGSLMTVQVVGNELSKTVTENLGQNLDVTLDKVNGQIESDLENLLTDSPQRLAELARKMGVPR